MHRAYYHKMPGGELGFTPEELDFIFSTDDYCSILVKLIHFISDIFILGTRKNTLDTFYCKYIQLRRWDILGTIESRLILNLLLIVL